MPELPPKLPHEPIHDYHRFLIYLRAGKKRTLYGAYSDFCIQYGLPVNKTLPYEWSRLAKTWNWQQRCLDFDQCWEEEERKQAIAHKNMVALRWKQRAEQAREQKWQIREALSKKIERMVATPVEELNWKIRDMLDIIETVVDMDQQLLPTALAEVKAIAELKDAGIIPAETADQIDIVLNEAYNKVKGLLSASPMQQE